MLELAIIVVRLLQYVGAAILFGSSLFFVYALPAGEPVAATLARPAKRWLALGATLLSLASLALIGAQASLFAGSFADGLNAEAMGAVVSSMDLGKAALARAVVAGIALIGVLLLPSSRAAWLSAAVCGAIAAASLAWLGHAGAGEGPLHQLHLVADVVHILAASAWLGALPGFLLLARADAGHFVLHRALRRFSAIGSLLVALLALTGLVNAGVLVGPVLGAWSTPYGQALAGKLGLFAAMLALAAWNRWRLTPALGRAPGADTAARLVRSAMAEAAIGLAVLALVAWLGTLAPPVERF